MTLEGVLLIACVLSVAYVGVNLRLLRRRQSGARAAITADGVQEVEVLVKGRYQPSTVVVTQGIPVRLLFNRQEDEPCSERVIFSVFRLERWLAPFATTVVEFIPSQAGDFLFTCGHGMYQGRLVVEERGTRTED